MKISKDFTMATEYTSNDFGWIFENAAIISDINAYIREYAKMTITGWKSINDVKASEVTIYRTWRKSGEFEAIKEYHARIGN